MLSNIPKKGKVLDIGCGTGLLLTRYARTGGQAVGIDVSSGMISKACEKVPEGHFLVGTGESLPFGDNSFDAVTSVLTFSYVNNPGKMLSEVIRVVKPGGRVVICTLSRTIFTSGLPAVYQLGELMRIRKIGVGNFNERYYTAEEMISLFRDAGFSDISTRKCSFAHVGMIDPLFTLARRIEPFVEERLPYLAYNICTSGRRPSH